jgi:hypothetical protein
MDRIEYTIPNNKLWFDMSFINCAQGSNANNRPGHDRGLAMYSATPRPLCGTAYCHAGEYYPKNSYYVDTPIQKLGIPEPVFACNGVANNFDLNMNISTDNPW